MKKSIILLVIGIILIIMFGILAWHNGELCIARFGVLNCTI